MPDPDPLTDATAALLQCERVLTRLDKMCCDPLRSPSMAELATTLRRAITGIEGDDTATAKAALGHLQDAGAQVGRLQVGCCAPARMPLYAELLEGLTRSQRSINASLGMGH